ncbi:DUF6268 family outer membrane beta-barrel protein [Psychroserpens luteus]|uniref:DUF6268 family outer membrane beta-barrel protein n=1 Tax=Psychroserpens luteus TaxID=1434066 RepID=A0ABW5ZZQ8_9FLAO|nr:DUF6268 family outer membrane beta-barrel protein [Psychroserpens luteus]
MNKLTLKIGILICLFSTQLSAQLNDLARIDYTSIPASSSSIEYSRIRALFNYPIKLKKEETYLLIGLDYSHLDLKMDDNPSFDKTEIDGFQLLDLNIGYTTPINKDWRFGVKLKPGFSSNLTANDLNLEDIVLSGDVVFIKDKTKDENVSKPWRLILGVSYSGNRGFPFPLPFISYYKKFNPSWSYNVGVPKSNLQYHISSVHRLKLYAELDGVTSNLQRGVAVDNTETAESINMSLILGGLQYEYHFTKHLQFYARTSYIFSNTVNLRDGGKNNIKSLDNSNSLYLRTGVRFKI